MSGKHFAIVWSLTIAPFCAGMAPAEGQEARAGRELAAEVRAAFSAACASCHGPQLPKPRAGFGYVLDLRRLAADRDKVVPYKPDESGLWQVVHNDEMPPPNSPSGPLTVRQKEVVRAWIAGGAPAEDSATVRDSPGLPSQEEAHNPSAPPVVWRALLWLGKLHLLLVHFPIALLIAAGLGELWSVWTGRRAPSVGVRFCLGFAAAFAVPAVLLGWLFALGGRGSAGLLDLHRWVGTAAGVLAVAIAASSEEDARRGVRSWSTRVLLLAGVLLTAVAAHFGGVMVHGKDFYDW